MGFLTTEHTKYTEKQPLKRFSSVCSVLSVVKFSLVSTYPGKMGFALQQPASIW
jgi:hypothetical protein